MNHTFILQLLEKYTYRKLNLSNNRFKRLHYHLIRF